MYKSCLVKDTKRNNIRALITSVFAVIQNYHDSSLHSKKRKEFSYCKLCLTCLVNCLDFDDFAFSPGYPDYHQSNDITTVCGQGLRSWPNVDSGEGWDYYGTYCCYERWKRSSCPQSKKCTESWRQQLRLCLTHTHTQDK